MALKTTFVVKLFNGKRFFYAERSIPDICCLQTCLDYVYKDPTFDFYFANNYFVKGIDIL